MTNDIKPNPSSLQASKRKLEEAFARLERAIGNKTGFVDKSKEASLELMAANEEIAKLREKNKLASKILDSRINQIRKILGS